jgi:POT family proton-dependent oligopeptide transporter
MVWLAELSADTKAIRSMASRKYQTVPSEQTTMPAGIPYIVGNEAAERFSFYGMKSILALFMTKYLVDAAGQPAPMSDAEATERVAEFLMWAYSFPIIGAILCDWLFGKYRMIMSLSLLYCAGHLVLALMDINTSLGIDQRTLLYWGLALIAIGSGGVKPCVSSHVGDQFGRANSHLLPVVYGWFYFSINLGAAISTVLTPWLRETYGPSVAFGVPGILMGVATLVFWLGRYKYVHVPATGRRFFSETFSPAGAKAIRNLIPLYILVAMFWCLFDQTGSRWVLQAQHLNRFVGSFEIRPDQLQAANPILVMILIPLFSYVIYPAINRIFPLTPLRKIGIGMGLTVISFLIPGWLEVRIGAGETPSMLWQVLAYVALTSAEVMVSIVCLEFSYTQAPNTMKSFIMSLYLLSVALGNLLTKVVNNLIKNYETAGTPILQGANYYWFFAACMAATLLVYLVWSPFYRGDVHIQSDPDSPSDAAA